MIYEICVMYIGYWGSQKYRYGAHYSCTMSLGMLYCSFGRR